jgi:lipopolysaccharide export system ATP-binding protein
MHLRARRGLGYLPQDRSIFRRLTVEENLRAIAELQPISRQEIRGKVDALIEEMRLTRFARQRGSTLSGGETRRVEIARALVTDPSFMLLDEPFAGIDPITVAELQGLIADLRKRGLGVLITDHNVRETLRITDRAYLVYEGKIRLSGTSSELAADPSARAIYLGQSFSL